MCEYMFRPNVPPLIEKNTSLHSKAVKEGRKLIYNTENKCHTT